MRKTSSDVVIGAGLLAFSAFATWRTLRISGHGTSSTVAGPSFLPWVMIGAVAILAVMLIIRAIRMAPAREALAVDVPDQATQPPNTVNLIRILIFVILLIAYSAAFMTVGYLPATFIVFIAGMLIMGERRPLMLLVLPALITLAVWYGFTRFLQVWLP